MNTDFESALKTALDTSGKTISDITRNKSRETFDEKRYQWKPSKNEAPIDMHVMSTEMLQKCIDHCKSMISSTDPEHLGREGVITLLKKEYDLAGAELVARAHNKSQLYSDLYKLLNKPEYLAQFPPTKYSSTPIGDVIYIDDKFSKISVEDILNASKNYLPKFNRKYITLTFIIELGINFTREEINEFLGGDYAQNRIKLNLNIPDQFSLIEKEDGLTYQQLRSALNLKNTDYANLTTSQLNVLYDVILPRLISKTKRQLAFWQQKSQALQEVLSSKK